MAGKTVLVHFFSLGLLNVGYAGLNCISCLAAGMQLQITAGDPLSGSLTCTEIVTIVVTAQLNLNWSWCLTLKWVGSHHPTTRNF